jgi:pimeloyl-ACP methyl ester carboxylesterase
MSTPKKPKLAPDEAWDALEKMAVDDEVERVLALSDEALDAELKAAGADPVRVRERGEALGRKLVLQGTSVGAAPRTRWVAWLAAAAFGALVVSFVAVNFSGTMARFRPVPIGPDEGGLAPPPDALARERVATLREQGFAACAQGSFGECQQKLDDAMRLDPAGEADPRVVQARKDVAVHERPEKPKPSNP